MENHCIMNIFIRIPYLWINHWNAAGDRWGSDDTTAEHILIKVRSYDAIDFIYVRFSLFFFLSGVIYELKQHMSNAEHYIRNNAQHYIQNFR